MRRASPVLKLGRSYRIVASQSGSLVVNVGGNSLVSVWDTRSRSKIARLRDVKAPHHVAISPGDDRLTVKSVTGEIGLYDLTTLSFVGAVQPVETEGAGPAFTPDGRYIVDADWDGAIRLIDATTLDTTVLKRYENCMVRHIDHVSGSNRFLFLITPKKVGVPAFSGEVLVDWRYPFDQHAPIEHVTSFWMLKAARISPIRGRVTILSSEPEGEAVVLLDQNMTDIAARSETKRRSGSSYTHAIAWSSDEQCLAVLRPHKMELLEGSSLGVVLEIEFEYACCVDFTPDGTALLIGSWQSGYYIPLSELWSVQHLP